jgi:hypothetical protein
VASGAQLELLLLLLLLLAGRPALRLRSWLSSSA